MSNEALRRQLERLVQRYERAYNADRAELAKDLHLEIRKLMSNKSEKLKLLAELLNAESPITAQELRNKVGMYPDGLVAFRKRFSEDKKELKNMGVPITVLSVGDSTKDDEENGDDNGEEPLWRDNAR